MDANILTTTEGPTSASQTALQSQGNGVEGTGEETGDVGEEESTGSSEVSLSEDLREDLEDALSRNFNFQGKFAFGTNLSTAPNPGLQIAQLGLIGLPLSERDAQSIKSIASQAPFGHGEQLVVDTTVRHTWEVEPDNTITFANPLWNSFIESTVKTVCTQLGVSPSSKPPKCELYKLLLYEAGSHFLPHQDTEKAPGMFGTIIIVLPSLYTGGQVCVSHGSQKQVFDFSSHGFSTSLLAWYADVIHEVKPVTSGYRLALSYNLIHKATSSPLPSLPSTDSAAIHLKHIFRKWSKRAYNDAPQTIAYILEHKYSRVDLNIGEKALKGADAHMIGVLHHLAVEEGVAVGLAELECHVVGSASEEFDPYCYSKRARYGYDEMDSDDCDDTPTMGEETDRSTAISYLVDLGGKGLIGKGRIVVSNEELIPSDPFDDIDPDDQEYEGYMGNYPGDVQYWYRRAVLVLYLAAGAQDLLLEAEGSSYAVSQLKLRDSNQSSAQDLKLANYVLDHLDQNREWGLYISILALRWKDSDLWLKAMYKCGAEKRLSILGEEKLIAAWETFGFDVLRPLFENAVAQHTTLKAQIEMIASFLPRAKTEEDRTKVSMWCNEQRASVLSHLKPPVKEDVPIIIDVLNSRGMQFFVETIEPQLARYQSTFGFLLEFVRSLQGEKARLSDHPSSEATFKQAIVFCLTSAAGQWKEPESPHNSYGHHGRPTGQRTGLSFARIKELCELCIVTEEMGACNTLFVSLVEDTTQIVTKIKNYFIPLVPELRRMLNSRNIPLNIQPFADFFRYLIETFLVSVLGAKTEKMRHNAIRKLGCGCVYCQELDRFLFSSDAKKEFRYNQKERVHLEQRLRSGSDIVTFATIRSGRPHGLQVTKHEDIVAAASWEGRQKAAKSFLASFGGDAAVRLIMGAKFSDITKAVTGEKAYAFVAKPFDSAARVAVESARPVLSLGNAKPSGAVVAATVHPSLASSSNAPSSSNVVAGTKRKSLGFIDLSGSP